MSIYYIKMIYRGVASPANFLLLLTAVWIAASARISTIFEFTMRQKPTVPENILVFRTIVTILSYLPRSVPIAAFDNLKDQSISNEDAIVLQLTEAFTQLAHIGNGKHVIAASANSSMDHDKAEIQVVTSPEPPALLDIQPSLSGLVPMARKCLKTLLVLVRNDRCGDSSTFSQEDYPVLEEPTAPGVFKKHGTALKSIIHLQDEW